MECGTRLAVAERPAGEDRAPVSPPAAAIPVQPGAAVLPESGRAGRPHAEKGGAGTADDSGPLPQRPVNPVELPASHPEWRMSPAGPLPEQPRRRWVVWIIGSLGVCLVLCVTLWVLGSTVFRGPVDSFLATQVAEATRQAGGQ